MGQVDFLKTPTFHVEGFNNVESRQIFLHIPRFREKAVIYQPVANVNAVYKIFNAALLLVATESSC